MLSFGRRKIHLAALQSTLLIIFLLLLLATFTQTRDGEVRVKQDNAPDVFFAWTAHPDGCVDYRFTAEGARAIWLGADGLASIEPMNYGRYCDTTLRTLRIITSDGREVLYLVGKLAWPSLDAWWQAVATAVIVVFSSYYSGSLLRLVGISELSIDRRLSAQPRLFLLVLIASLSFFYVVRFSLLASVMSNRSHVVEIDDSYSYIWTGQRLRDCLPDCPALQELRKAMYSPTSNTELHNIRYREYHRLDTVYHPLTAAFLAMTNNLIDNWDISYLIFTGTAYVIQSCAIFYFLFSLWGSAAASLGVILASLTVFSGSQGLHYAVPSNLALMMAFFLWGWILRRRHRVGYELILIVLLTCLVHTIGRIYALFALGLLVLLLRDQLSNQHWRVLVASAVVITLYWIAAHFSGADSRLLSPIDSVHTLIALTNQLRAFVGQIAVELRFMGGGSIAVGAGMLVVLMGYFVVHREASIVPTFVLILSLNLLLSAYVRPLHPNEALSRAWIAVQIVSLGGLSFLITCAAARLVANIRHKNFKLSSNLVPSLLLLVGLRSAYIHLDTQSVALTRLEARMRDVQNYKFSLESLQDALKVVRGTILYTVPPSVSKGAYIEDGPMTYSLVNGAYNHPAIFLPMLDEDQLRSTEVAEACWLITQIPAVRENGVIHLSYAEGMTVQLAEAQDLTNLRVMVAAASVPYQLILETEGRSYNLTVDPSMHQIWQSFPIPSGMQSFGFVLRREGGGKKDGGIMSLRFEGDTEYWAWDAGLKLDYAWERRLIRRNVTANFSIKDIIPPVWPDAEIFDDSSDLLILKRSGC
jgi:hypothetical protein